MIIALIFQSGSAAVVFVDVECEQLLIPYQVEVS